MNDMNEENELKLRTQQGQTIMTRDDEEDGDEDDDEQQQ